MELKQIVNSKYAPLFTNKKRYVILMGGRGAGRSTVASQFANAKLVSDEYFRCAIMRYILGDIRNSIYREITDRATENGIIEALSINESMMTIEYGQNTINAVGFKKSSGEQKSKLKSLANYTTVIIEEADEIAEEDFMQLDDSLRTVKGDITIIILLNPPAKNHWIIKRWFNLLPTEVKGFYEPELKAEIDDTLFLRTSFEDNLSNLSEQSIKNYRNYENTKPAHFYQMIKGLVPEVMVGKIFSGWRVIDDIPHEARLERIGLDFGYSNDPTAITAIYYYNGGYILDQVAYQKELSNKMIANILNNHAKALVGADSAEPKSIDEIRGYGVTIVGAKKGADSVNHGIQIIKDQKISVTKRSDKIIEEYENYSWFVDKEGNILNTPKDAFNHSMDSIRYAFSTMNLKTVQEKLVEDTKTNTPQSRYEGTIPTYPQENASVTEEELAMM